jgi:hypothetical protein
MVCGSDMSRNLHIGWHGLGIPSGAAEQKTMFWKEPGSGEKELLHACFPVG